MIGSTLDFPGGSGQLSIANLLLSDDYGSVTGTTLSTGNLGVAVALPTARATVPSASGQGAGTVIYVRNGAELGLWRCRESVS